MLLQLIIISSSTSLISKGASQMKDGWEIFDQPPYEVGMERRVLSLSGVGELQMAFLVLVEKMLETFAWFDSRCDIL